MPYNNSSPYVTGAQDVSYEAITLAPYVAHCKIGFTPAPGASRFIITEGGDHITTEAGDRLITEN